LQIYIKLAALQDLRVVPPKGSDTDWKSLQEAMAGARKDGGDSPAAEAMISMLLAYAKGDAKSFNAELARYNKQLTGPAARAVGKADWEVAFNQFAPFAHCEVLYVFVIVLSCLSWLFWREPLARAAFALAVLTLVVHTAALGVRIYLSE